MLQDVPVFYPLAAQTEVLGLRLWRPYLPFPGVLDVHVEYLSPKRFRGLERANTSAESTSIWTSERFVSEVADTDAI